MAAGSSRPSRTGAFAALLRRHRESAGLTQAELAVRAGLGVRTVSNLERGINTSPYPSTVRVLADALGLADQGRGELLGAARGSTHPTPHRARPRGGYLGAAPVADLVARDAERGAILETMSSVAAGEGRFLLLAGEPGIGKTRLAQEASVLTSDDGFLVATGRCYEPAKGTPFTPFFEVFAALPVGGADAGAEGPSNRWPALSALLPEAVTTARVEPRPSPDQAHRTYRAATEFVQELAADRPVAVLLDDLQWADVASLELLAHLARHTHGDRVLLLGTYRNVEVGHAHPLRELVRSLAREGLVETVAVGRLDRDETTRLINHHLHDAPVSEEFARHIYQHTDGNPFFTVETLMALIERGDVSRIDGRWVRRELTDLEPPASVSDAIAERASRLSPATQRLLQTVSVLGEVFDVEDLAIVDLEDEALDTALDEAVDSGLLSTVGDRFAFDHWLTFNALYAGLSPARRRRLHRLAGEALERRSEAVRRRRLSDIARHLEAGGAPDRAAPYLLLAGDAAAALHAYGEAAQHYRHMLELAEETGDLRCEASARERLAQVLAITAHHDEAVEQLDEASRLLDRVGDADARLRVEGTIAHVLHRRGSSEAAAARLAGVVAEREPIDATESQHLGVAVLLRGLALVRLSLGEYDLALESAERAMAIVRDGAPDALRADVGVALGTIRLSMAMPDEAVEVLERTVSLARRAEAVTPESDALMALQWALLMQGNADRGRAMGHRGLELARRSGDTDAESQHNAGVGLNLFYVGDWTQAARFLEHSVELGRSRSSMFSAIPPSYLGLVRRGQGDLASAARLYDEAAAAPDLRTFGFDAYLDARRAELDLAQGDPATALRRLESWVAKDPPSRNHGPMLLTMAAEACLGLGDARRGEELADRAIHRAEATKNRVDGVDALRVRGLCLLQQQQRLDEGRGCLELALERARALPHPYAEARVHRDLGNRDEARAIFERLGAMHDLAELG